MAGAGLSRAPRGGPDQHAPGRARTQRPRNGSGRGRSAARRVDGLGRATGGVGSRRRLRRSAGFPENPLRSLHGVVDAVALAPTTAPSAADVEQVRVRVTQLESAAALARPSLVSASPPARLISLARIRFRIAAGSLAQRRCGSRQNQPVAAQSNTHFAHRRTCVPPRDRVAVSALACRLTGGRP
jgi:hypothetical protein